MMRTDRSSRPAVAGWGAQHMAMRPSPLSNPETSSASNAVPTLSGEREVNRAIDGILVAKVALDGLTDQDLVAALLADPVGCDEWFATLHAARLFLERVDRVMPAALCEMHGVAA